MATQRPDKIIPFPGPTTPAAAPSSSPASASGAFYRANSYPLRAGDSGTFRTVRYMRSLVDGREGVLNPQIIALATQIVSAVANRDASGEINAIYNWVKDNISFRNEDGERLQSPLVTMQLRAGDCDDHSMLIAALLRALGHTVAFRTVAVGNNPDYSHVYAVVQNKRTGDWIPLDTTVASATPGWEVQGAQRSQTFTPMSGMRGSGMRIVRRSRGMGDDSGNGGGAVDDTVKIINALNPIVAGVGSRIAHGQTPVYGIDIGTTLNTPNLGSVNGIPLSTIIWGGLIFTGIALATRKGRRR